MFLPLGLTIAEMLTYTYLEVPILDRYRIQSVDTSSFGNLSLAIIEQNDLFYGTEIIEDRNTDYASMNTLSGQKFYPVGVNFGYTIFMNGMYHKYPDSIDRFVYDDNCLKNYVPPTRITEYFLKLI